MSLTKRVPLPSKLWVRSTKMPEWAINLDPESIHYGRKMREWGGEWIWRELLTFEEIAWALQEPELAEYRQHLLALQEFRTQRFA